MAALVWDDIGSHLYEIGTDHGVLYVQDSDGDYMTGVPWNGLISVSESIDDADVNKFYADNINYASAMSSGTYKASVDAYTWPEEFDPCIGASRLVDGVNVNQQNRTRFGFVYRTLIGNETSSYAEIGYKIHIVWNAIAIAQDRQYETISDSVDATTFSWDFEASPVRYTIRKPKIIGYDENGDLIYELGPDGIVYQTYEKRASSMVIDSTKIDPEKVDMLLHLEDLLFGSEENDPTLPSINYIIRLFNGDESIDDHSGIALIDKVVSSNGKYYAEGDGVDGYRSVDVKVSGGAAPALVSSTFSANGYFNPPQGYDGWNQVTVNVQPSLGSVTFSENGIYLVPYPYDGWEQVVVDVPQSGGDGDLDALIEGTLSYVSGSASKIRNYAFYYCSSLTSANFPACTSIESYAFVSCSSLASVSFPICTTIGNAAFMYCYNLTSANFPVCTSIKDFAFKSCRSLTSIDFPSCTSIGFNAFQDCSSLTSVSFPTCTTIRAFAFNGCTSLASVSFPICNSIESNVFQFCSSLTSISFPVCTYMGSYAFRHCSGLTSVNFPVCTSIRDSTFYSCYHLTSVSFPSCANIGVSAFQYCSSITSVSFPACTNIGAYAFMGCISLTSISFPICTAIGNATFQYCSSLTSVSFPVCTSIGASTFRSCYNLISLYLLNSSVCVLYNSNAFFSTPIGGYSASAGRYGSIFVPTSLVDAYKTATNWSYFSSRFVGV